MSDLRFEFTTESVGFAIVCVVLLLSALRTVTARNLIHCVLWLGVSLSMTAFLFVLLRSPFLAGVQILLYTGGVITLMLFGIMLTNSHEAAMIENESSGQAKGVLLALATFGVMATAILGTEGLTEMEKPAIPVEHIGRSFLGEHLFAFELLSVLLLIVMIGAIVLARKKDFIPPALPEKAKKGGGDTPSKSAPVAKELSA